jgi:hypothetical protein
MRTVTDPTNKGCYCLCTVAHPGSDEACQPNNAVTSRDVNGRPVQMCGPCAEEFDRRHAPAPAPALPEPRSLDARLTELAEHAMPAEEGERARAALAFIREAWSGGDYYADPRQALEVIADNANDLLALIRIIAAASEVA